MTTSRFIFPSIESDVMPSWFRNRVVLSNGAVVHVDNAAAEVVVLVEEAVRVPEVEDDGRGVLELVEVVNEVVGLEVDGVDVVLDGLGPDFALVLVPERDEGVRGAVVVGSRNVLALPDEAANGVGVEPLGRRLLPGVEVGELDLLPVQRGLRIRYRELYLDYARLVSFRHLPNRGVVGEVEPAILWAGIGKLGYLTLPVADGCGSVHEIHVDVVQVLNRLARRVDGALIETLAPSAILRLAFLRFLCLHDEVANLYANCVLFLSGE